MPSLSANSKSLLRRALPERVVGLRLQHVQGVVAACEQLVQTTAPFSRCVRGATQVFLCIAELETPP